MNLEQTKFGDKWKTIALLHKHWNTEHLCGTTMSKECESTYDQKRIMHI